MRFNYSSLTFTWQLLPCSIQLRMRLTLVGGRTRYIYYGECIRMKSPCVVTQREIQIFSKNSQCLSTRLYEWEGDLGFDPQHGQDIYTCKMSRPPPGCTQPSHEVEPHVYGNRALSLTGLHWSPRYRQRAALTLRALRDTELSCETAILHCGHWETLS
jgi:hypothetical protein